MYTLMFPAWILAQQHCMYMLMFPAWNFSSGTIAYTILELKDLLRKEHVHASHSERGALSKRTTFLGFVFLCTPQKYIFTLSEALFSLHLYSPYHWRGSQQHGSKALAQNKTEIVII